MAVMVIVAVPMYICATGSIPIALSLMLKGLSPGTAFVLLMAGPAANFASVMILSRTNGRRATVDSVVGICVPASGANLPTASPPNNAPASAATGLMIAYGRPSSEYVAACSKIPYSHEFYTIFLFVCDNPQRNVAIHIARIHNPCGILELARQMGCARVSCPERYFSEREVSEIQQFFHALYFLGYVIFFYSWCAGTAWRRWPAHCLTWDSTQRK